MKNLLTLLCCFAFCLGLTAQKPLPVDSATMKIGYKEVVKIDSLQAKDLYGLALSWAKAHIDTGQVAGQPKLTIKQLDGDSNRLIAIGRFKGQYSDYQNTVEVYGYYTLVLEARNGRARIKITDLEHDNIGPGKDKTIPYEQTYYGLAEKSKPTQNAWLAFFGQSDTTVKSIISSFKTYLLHPPVAARPYVDEW